MVRKKPYQVRTRCTRTVGRELKKKISLAVCRCTICGAQADSEARIPGITMTARVDIFTNTVTSNPQTPEPKFRNQICAPRLNQTNHQRAFHTTFDNQYENKKTRSTEIQTNPFPPPSLHPSSSSTQTHPSPHI